METILVNMQRFTRVIHMIYLGMNLCMEMNLNTTLKSTKKDISQLTEKKTWERVNRNVIPPGPNGKPRHVIKGT